MHAPSQGPRQPSRQASEPPRLDRALRRLTVALSRLDEAAGRRIERERAAIEAEGSRTETLEAMADERTRLQAELEHGRDRLRRLETINREVSGRLDGAMSTIRAVLEPR